MEREEQRTVWTKKHDKKFVSDVEKHQKKEGLSTFKAALKDLANKGLQK